MQIAADRKAGGLPPSLKGGATAQRKSDTPLVFSASSADKKVFFATLRVTSRINEDEMFVGLCAEFGLLSHLDDTPKKAFSGIRNVVAFAVKALDEDGAPIPEPLST